mgnify:CR=1 FL=1
MKKIITIVIVSFVLILSACSSTQSLQEYYVDNSDNPNFLKLDIPTSVLNLSEADLTDAQRDALESFQKLNILAFKKTNQNVSAYTAEKENVKTILKNDKFNELMKISTGMGKASVQYIGDDDAIDEVVIYGSSDDKGFALIRVLGDDMNPAHLMELIKAIEKSDYKGEGLEQLEGFLK